MTVLASAPLGEVCPAKPLKPKLLSSREIVWQLNLDRVEANSGVVLSKQYAPASDAGNSTHWFDERHVLYSKLRPYLNKVVLPDELGIATTELVPLLPDTKVVDRKYLAYYLRSSAFVKWVSNQVAGAKMPRVSMKVFWNHKIPLLTLKEQKRIAVILDKADAIRRKRQQAIQIADQFLRSVFLYMFGDPVMNSKEWKVKRMGDVIEFKGGSQPAKSTFITEPREGYTRLIQIRDFKSDRYPTYIPSELAKRQFEVDDVMIARYGPPVFQILRGLSGSYNVALMKAVPKDEITKDFIFHLLQLPAYQNRVVAASERTAGQTGVNLDLINNFDLPLPPLDKQNEICEILKKVENGIHTMNIQQGCASHMFHALSQKAFTGEL